jgi:putative transposase
MLIEKENPHISISRQCNFLALNRSTLYYKGKEEVSDYNLYLMGLIDKQYTKTPFYGSRRMTAYLKRLDYDVNRKRIQRLMRMMGIEAIYPKPNLSKRGKENEVYPYLLKGLKITESNQVWATDITYIGMQRGWLYLTAIMDWHSRYVLSWELSTTLEVGFCIDALKKALIIGKPQIFNSDQGVQYTSSSFTQILKDNNIQISMDSRGRAFDNIFIERLWRSLKYEEVYIKDYSIVKEAREGIRTYFEFYNNERPHQSLGYMTPYEVYYSLGGRRKDSELKVYKFLS